MLVLTRKSEQSVIIGRDIEVKILGVHGDQVSLGFSAPDEVSIYRKEVYAAIQQQNKQATQHGANAVQTLRNAITCLLPGNGQGNPKQKGVMPEETNTAGR